MRSSRTETFDAVIDGRECQIEFTRVTTFVHDAHYGADADGNRGVPMDFIDEDLAEGDALIYYTDTEDDFVVVPAALRAEVDKAIDAYIERTEPTCDLDDEEPDWDAINDARRDREAEEELE
ncbi:MAG: hypothetical protein NUV51_04490 [Sulfuricaulis sp.]|nr:hypothetical protein [Sulfuricaulis sp.]